MVTRVFLTIVPSTAVYPLPSGIFFLSGLEGKEVSKQCGRTNNLAEERIGYSIWKK